jgi:hypothetical protein
MEDELTRQIIDCHRQANDIAAQIRNYSGHVPTHLSHQEGALRAKAEVLMRQRDALKPKQDQADIPLRTDAGLWGV